MFSISSHYLIVLLFHCFLNNIVFFLFEMYYLNILSRHYFLFNIKIKNNVDDNIMLYQCQNHKSR